MFLRSLMAASTAIVVLGAFGLARGAPLSSDLYVAVDGNDANACTQAAPCLTLNRGYRAAQPGDRVLVMPGTYPFQEILPDATKTSEEDVVIDGLDPELVKVTGSTEVTASHLTIQNINTPFQARYPADDVTYQNARGLGARAAFVSGGTSRISILNNDLCCRDSADLAFIATGSGYASPTQIRFEGNYLHDQTNISKPSFHTDGLQVGACVDCSIRGNRFERLYHQQLFMRSWGGGTIHNVDVENNIFLPSNPGGIYEVVLSEGDGSARPSTCGRVWFRNNTLTPTVGFRLSCPETPGTEGVSFRGNIIQWLRSSSCTSYIGTYGVDWDYNLIGVLDPDNVTCSPNDVLGDPLLTADGHIQEGSAALDRGDPAGPADDYDGDARPQGAGPDIGADEAVLFGLAPVVDDFNRPNASTLGPSWSSPYLTFSGNRFHDVLDGTAYAPTTVYQQSWLNTTTFGPNVEAHATLAVKPTVANDATFLCVRLREIGDGTTDGYCVWHKEQPVAEDTWELRRVDNGVGTVIASGVGELAAGERFGVEMLGDALRAMRRSGGQWVETAVAIDSTYPGAGYVGISSVRGAKLDDLAAGVRP